MLGGLGEVSFEGGKVLGGKGERTCCHGEGFGADFEGEDCGEKRKKWSVSLSSKMSKVVE